MSLTQGIRKVYFYSWLPYSADRRQHIDDGILPTVHLISHSRGSYGRRGRGLEGC
ncbi:hypothetical protein H6F78_03610 [Coleofasciculus sp. FACHB-64]|uniref:hypothetical protein n=1 Tax=Cyanophyceae TaxID=3028117 RepID=UPI001685093D|nr:hypothetical protein [Coleofasciculus sp. FACHB-64]MBD2044728.1 hypothetical protein [Coleofasciculus sp. FACHB-64]